MLGEVLGELQQGIELFEVERDVSEIDGDLLGVGDEFQQVVGDQFQLFEDGFPPRPEAVNVADVLDDFPIGQRANPSWMQALRRMPSVIASVTRALRQM